MFVVDRNVPTASIEYSDHSDVQISEHEETIIGPVIQAMSERR